MHAQLPDHRFPRYRTVRQLLNLRPSPEFERWLETMGIMANGRLTKRAGDRHCSSDDAGITPWIKTNWKEIVRMMASMGRMACRGPSRRQRSGQAQNRSAPRRRR